MGDIQAVFHMEYKTAKCIRRILKERLDVDIDEHEVEIGYLAMHIERVAEQEE